MCWLRQQFFHDPAWLDPRQLLIKALVLEREPLMVEAEQVQDGGVEVADVDRNDDGKRMDLSAALRFACVWWIENAEPKSDQ